MLDLHYIRENLKEVRRRLGNRGYGYSGILDRFEQLDAENRQAITRHEALLAERNQLSKEYGRQKGTGNTAELAERVGQINEQIGDAARAVEQARVALRQVLISIPNLVQEPRCVTALHRFEGRNPDCTSEDVFGYLVLEGFSPEEIIAAEAYACREVMMEFGNLRRERETLERKLDGVLGVGI